MGRDLVVEAYLAGQPKQGFYETTWNIFWRKERDFAAFRGNVVLACCVFAFRPRSSTLRL